MVERATLPRVAATCRRVLLATVCLLVLLQFVTGAAFADVAASSLADGSASSLADGSASPLADGSASPLADGSASSQESVTSGNNASESPLEDDGGTTSGP